MAAKYEDEQGSNSSDGWILDSLPTGMILMIRPSRNKWNFRVIARTILMDVLGWVQLLSPVTSQGDYG